MASLYISLPIPKTRVSKRLDSAKESFFEMVLEIASLYISLSPLKKTIVSYRLDSSFHRKNYSKIHMASFAGPPGERTVLVIGATGAIGRSLVAQLCASGVTVVAAVRRTPLPESLVRESAGTAGG